MIEKMSNEPDRPIERQTISVPIAVVDDTEQNLYTIGRYLRRAGFEVWEGRTGADALRLAHNRPELIILDVKLPDMLGYEVCRRIKSNPATASIPVLHTSATFMEMEHKVEGLEGGADGYLTAPIKPEELIATVRSLLRMYDAEKKAGVIATQWQTTFDAISSAVCLIDRDGNVERCNAFMAQIVGRPCSEIISRSFFDVAAWASIKTLPYTRMLETQHRETLEAEVHNRWWRITVDPVFDEEACLNGAVCVIADISERKRSEAQLRRSEANLSDFFENAPIGLHWANPEGIILRANHTELEMLGYSREEYIGRNFADFHVSRKMAEDIIGRLRRGETIHNDEAQLRCKDGSIIDVAIASNVLWEDGQFVHTRCFTRDITQRKNAERALAGAKAELQKYAAELERRVAERTVKLQESNKELESFCYTIAHDLRAPLRAIEGFTAALAEDYASGFDETGRDYSMRIIVAAQRMDHLIQDLLSYGRISQTPMEFDWQDLKEVCDFSATQFGDEITERNAQLRIQEPLPAIWANATLLERIVANLIGNALKFQKPGRQPVIDISAEELPGSVRVKIRDNGIGIEPQYKEKIFKIFERLALTNNVPGTGIGLAIVKRAVERMNGQVGIESTPGEGSCFWFELPKPGAPESGHPEDRAGK